MNDSSNAAGDEMLDPLGSALDAGLHAAFGRAETQHAQSVVDCLEESLGIQPRVLLRDVAGEHAPVAVSGRSALKRENAVGRYQLAGEIGRGGVGIVLRGRDPDLGRDVAIKVLRREFLERGHMVARFVEEAQIAAQLQHPGIPSVFELGMAESQRPFFSMKLIKGRTLAALLRERQDMTQDRQEFVGMFASVCQAVAYAHAKGVIHRDLKPSNVMVGSFGEVQVVDWGLAKVLACGELADEALNDASQVETVRSGSSAAQSLVGSVLGTPAYMSPEQARGETDTLSERSDVFALGAILCEILTGKPPFSGDRDEAIERARVGDLDDALARLDVCEADADLVDITRQCLSPDAGDRPRDAGDVANRISAYLASLSERVRASELAAAKASVVATQERRARRLTLALGSVILAAVLLIGGGLAWVQNERREEQMQRASTINTELDEAAGLLGQALAARVGEKQPWAALELALDQIRQRMTEGAVDIATQQRAETLFAKAGLANRDRRLIEKIEEVVIMGATHDDKHSWLWMEEELRLAFKAYGIDIEKQSQEAIAEQIKKSDMAAHLTDGLELWMGTCGHLYNFGVSKYPVAELMTWIDVLTKADPDPFASAVRKLVYAQAPAKEEVRKVMASADFADVRPRTLAWLASAAFRTGDLELVHDIFRRAVLLYPDDLMLNFDYAYNMVIAKDYHRAIRSYERCLAIRPDSAGIWRSHGVALRNVKEYRDSIDALKQSITLQPDHAPTHLDLGITFEESGDKDNASRAYEHALKLNKDLVKAQQRLESLKAGAGDQGD